MPDNKHTPDIKCYRINYDRKYWANVAAKVGNQCSSPVGAVFAVNALCDAYEDIAKQRDELLEVMLTAAETFASYAEIHAAKTPPDIVKAEFNRDRAQMCFAAIASVKEKK